MMDALAVAGGPIRAWFEAARGAVPETTMRALRADARVFSAWCAERGLGFVPAAPGTVALFVDEMAASGRAVATVRRYVSSIAMLHRMAQVGNPCRDEVVRLAVKRMARGGGVRPVGQAAAAGRGEVARMIDGCEASLIGLRDRAIIALGYDTLCRRGELACLLVDDLAFAPDGTGTALVRRGKADQDGVGSVRFLGRDTVLHVRCWMGAAAIDGGPLFRAVDRHGRVSGVAMDSGSVGRVIRRAAERAGLRLSGHSLRVGAAQDMVALGCDVGQVMQAGGWKSPAMVARYAERLLARRGAMARLAEAQGRA